MYHPPDERPQEPPEDVQSNARPKATLFCQRCGREGPVDGDWTERERAGHRDVHCPSCSHRLTSRTGRDDTLPAAPPAGRADRTPSRTLQSVVDTWTGAQALWQASLRLWTGGLTTGRTDC